LIAAVITNSQQEPIVHSNPNPHTQPTNARRRSVATGVAAVVLLATTGLAATGCAGNLVHSYRSFQSALDRGASCSELYDQRARFDDEDTLAKIDSDLEGIGCTSPDATRND
jgi:hypothetical protein